MMRMADMGLEFLTALVRMAVGMFLAGRILGREEPGPRTLLMGAGGTAAAAWALAAAPVPLFGRIGLESAWTAFLAGRRNRKEWRQYLYVCIFYEIGFFLWTFLAKAGIDLLGIWNGWELSGARAAGMAEGAACLGVVCICLYAKSRTEMKERDGFRLASALAVMGFVGTVSLTEQQKLTIPGDTLSMWMMLSLICMIAILVFRMRRQYEAERELAEIKAEQAKLLEREYAELGRMYETNARLFHDFHNHIGVLQQFLSQEKYGEARRYLDGLQQPLREMGTGRWTGDEAADYLIGSKAEAAKAMGVRLSIQAEYPRHANIRSADLCAVLGNLLDNALEAAVQAGKPENQPGTPGGQEGKLEGRWVSLTIRKIHRMLVIKMENSFSGTPVEQGGRLLTTKAEAGLHGWGIRSVQAAAEKYDGTVQTSYEGNVFCTVVTLSFPEREL